MGQGGLPPLPGQGDAAVAGPGAGQEGSLELDPLATVYAMYDRFMQEHPNVYKPETVDTVQGGVPGTQRIDPLAPAGSQQKSQFFAKPYQTVGPDQEIVQWTEMGPQRVYKGEQTFAPPTPKTQYGTIELDSKTGRWGQYSDAGKFEPIMTSEELAAKAKSGADQDIPNSVYNNNFNNALKDAYEKANPDQKAWIGKRIYNWFFGSDPEAFEDLIKPYLEKYNNYYRQEQGKNAPKSTPAPQPSAVKRKPLSAHFGASAPSSTQSKVFKPES